MNTDLRMMSFKIADADRALLAGISSHFSDASHSAILRRLIRQEAARIGLAPETVSGKPHGADAHMATPSGGGKTRTVLEA